MSEEILRTSALREKHNLSKQCGGKHEMEGVLKGFGQIKIRAAGLILIKESAQRGKCIRAPARASIFFARRSCMTIS